MATRSISQNVNFRGKKLSRQFVHALESAEKSKSKEVTLSKKCVNLSKDKVKDFFKEVK